MTNLYALIVGIEKYDLTGWNRSGPVAGAIEMAYWCNSIGMPYKNIHMFLSVNDQDAAWEKERKDQLGHFKRSGAKIVEDTSLDAIDTFWRSTLPTLSSVDSKLLVYWCGHGVTRPDRDRILLHTNYRPDNLSSRVTSADNLVASLATQTYRRFKEQLIVADVCGDFSSYSVSPNTHPPMNPLDSITQHCYFATADGQSTQIQNGIGQFTQSTLDVLKQYQSWPDLDDLKERMDKKFRNGSLKPFKISIRTPLEEYEISNNISAKANAASLQSSSEDIEQLISTCNAHIKKNELDELFQLLDDFLANAKSKAFDEARNSLQILQSDLNNFRMGELNGTLTHPDTQRRVLITRIQQLLKLIESKVGKGTNRSSSLKPSSLSSMESISREVNGKNVEEIASRGNRTRSLDSNKHPTGKSFVTCIEFTLDRPFHEFDESSFKSAFQLCTGIDAKKIRIASIRSGSTIVRVEGDSNVLQRVVEQFRESQEKLDLFCQLTGLTSLQWIIAGRSYKLDMQKANELTPLTRYTNTDDKDEGQNMTYSIGIITALEKEYAAVKALLKDCKNEHKDGHGAGRRYVGGKIASISGGEHKVVLALADMGNNVAATRATLLLSHFPTIETILMVGIAGGVPSPTKPEDHVRLGDVVISNKKGVVQYDMVKLQEIRACPISPSAEMIEGVRLLGADALLGKQPWNSHIDASLHSIGSERPPDTTDLLFDSKNPEVKVQHPVDPKRTKGLPRIFLGPIASANELLKDPIKRDALRDRFGVKAVEMEGSGIADATWTGGKGYLVIRGICDYCDSHKNDSWQEYASAVAAGYAVALIESMPTSGPASADSIGSKRPSPSKGISIPTPEKGTSTVTSDSEISSSPTVPPENPLEFFRQQIYKLLEGNEEMTEVLAHAIVSKNENSVKDHVIEYLIGNTVSTNEFPLRRFKRILEELVGKRIELKRDSFQTLTLLTEILEIASYPVEDCQRIEEAMQEILSSNTGNPAIGGLSTSKIEDAKKLLIATRLKLLGAEFSDLNVAQLLNKNMLDNSDVRLLMRKIHVVTEPTLKSDDLTLIEFYSKACIDDLNYAQSSSSYQDDLQDVLEEKSKVGAVVSLLLSNEKTEAIKQLRNRFPLLLVVGLPKESISLYKAIVRDLKDIDECLTDLCGNVKRVT